MEQDGIDIDLSKLPLNAKTFSMNFGFTGASANWGGFVNFLHQQSTLFLNAAEIGWTATARAVSYSNLSAYAGYPMIAVSFTIDAPLVTLANPSGTIPADNTSKLDGVPFSSFDIRLLQGTLDSVMLPAAEKEYLAYKSNYSNGQSYDQAPFDTYSGGTWSQSHALVHGTPHRKDKDIVLQCLMTASSLSSFKNNYDALLYALVGKQSSTHLTDETTTYKRSLLINSQTMNCYYKSQNVANFQPLGGKVWCQFSLTLGII